MGISVASTEWLFHPLFPGRIGIWECWFLWREENPSTRRKNLPEQGREPTTNSTQIWRRVQESNPGHIGGRPVLSPLRHLCYPKIWSWVELKAYYTNLQLKQPFLLLFFRKLLRSFPEVTFLFFADQTFHDQHLAQVLAFHLLQYRFLSNEPQTCDKFINTEMTVITCGLFS